MILSADLSISFVNTTKAICLPFSNPLMKTFSGSDPETIRFLHPGRESWISGKPRKTTPLLFTMSSISAKAVVPAPHACEVILKYRVFTHYPDGVTHAHNQRLQYTWAEKTITHPDGQKERIPRILVIHITNTVKNDERNPVYDVHTDHIPLVETEVFFPRNPARYILFRGRQGETYSYLSTNIRWIENCDEGRHSLVHTQNGSLPSMERLAEYTRQAPDAFLRPHHSYLVNPLYIRSIRRFSLTMADRHRPADPGKKIHRFPQRTESLERTVEPALNGFHCSHQAFCLLCHILF